MYIKAKTRLFLTINDNYRENTYEGVLWLLYILIGGVYEENICFYWRICSSWTYSFMFIHISSGMQNDSCFAIIVCNKLQKFQVSVNYNINNLIILRSVGSNTDFKRIFLFCRYIIETRMETRINESGEDREIYIRV